MPVAEEMVLLLVFAGKPSSIPVSDLLFVTLELNRRYRLRPKSGLGVVLKRMRLKNLIRRLVDATTRMVSYRLCERGLREVDRMIRERSPFCKRLLAEAAQILPVFSQREAHVPNL